MKKLASLIVDKKFFFLGVMVALTIACLVSMFHVKVNGDMTKYLPEDSSMKIGLDIMSAEFPDAGINATFKVMFDDLTQEQKKQVCQLLKDIPGVDTVSYVLNSSEYNRENHTLYVLQSHHKYGTKEEKNIETALKTQFQNYSMIWNNDNTGMIDIPIWVFVAAVAVLMLILFSTSGSWLEPFLFLGVIGCAILINMGTNIFLPSVSDITYSISAILQLVLSMDYSIILMNRYRQEKSRFDNKNLAMKAALAHAFSSVASSALTTVIGLIMLVFMRFKIGLDLGVVLAKGVFLSMVCVLLMLPGIILLTDKAICLTSKKSLKIPMGGLAKVSYKLRWVITALFVVLCAGSYFLQKQTNITYIFTKKDRILDTFPEKNTLVLLYENQDEEKLRSLVDKLYLDPNITSMMGEYAIFDKEYTASEIAKNLSALSDEMPLSEGIVNLLFYLKNNGKQVNTMTVSQMLNFFSDTLLKDSLISKFITPESFVPSAEGEKTAAAEADLSSLDIEKLLKDLSNSEELQKAKTARELAQLFSMPEEELKSLYALYYAEKDDVKTESITIKDFADFIVDNISTNPKYNSIFDQKTKNQLGQLKTFSDAEKMTKELDGSQIAEMMDLDKEVGSMMVVCYKALSSDYSPKEMTFAEFSAFLQKEILSKPEFTQYLDEETKAQTQKLEIFGSKEKLTAQHTAEEIASILGYEEKQAKQIFKLNSNAKTMSVQELINFVSTSNLINNFLKAEDKAQINTALGMVNATMNDTLMSWDQMANLLTMDKTYTKLLFTLKDSKESGKNWKVSMHSLINTLADNSTSLTNIIDKQNLELLSTGKAIINGAVSKKAFSANELSEITGMSSKQARQLLLLKKIQETETLDWKISCKQLVDFIVNNLLTDKIYSQSIPSNFTGLLKSAQKVINGVISKKSYTAYDMSSIMSGFSDKLNENIMTLLYLFYSSTQNPVTDYKMSVTDLFDYVTKDLIYQSRFSSVLDESTRSMILDAKNQMEDGKQMLKTAKHSRLIINSNYPCESKETSAFLKEIEDYCEAEFNGEIHLIGNSAMGYEMQKTFRKELGLITLLTIAAIFIIVCITFKSFSIPAILVLLVQCGVYMTVSFTGLIYGEMLYLALLIVECILMGATIDYGILLTNYYCEARRTMPIKDALKDAYEGSHHTILTSGLILVFVTAIVGNFFGDPTVSSIIRTISIGALSAVLLIMFVLPGVLAAFDKIIIRKKK